MSSPARSVSPFAPLVQGCAGLAGLYAPVSEATAATALQQAWDLGVRAFDAAPHYGVGLAEERLGRFLVEQPRESYVVSTKVGRLLVDDDDAPDAGEGFAGTPRRRRVRDYSADGIRRSIEDSLTRMGLDRLDLVLIHDPEDHLDQALSEAAPALSALRSEGVIGGYGVGTNYADVADVFVTETDIDHVLIAGRYTLLDRQAAGLVDHCAQAGVAVLAAGVVNSGLLVDPRPGANFNYEAAPDALVQAAQRMRDACQSYGVELRAAALQFPDRHPAVAAVVMGGSDAAAVRDCVEQRQVAIAEALWAELELLAPSEDAFPASNRRVV